MSSPLVVHVVRPYQSEEEYLAAEAWTIDARGMVLLGESEVSSDIAVVFDVTLANGAKVIRAEGRSSGYLAQTDERPGGLRVRFKRFGAQTKAFIDRALRARAEQLASAVSSRPPPAQALPVAPSLSALAAAVVAPPAPAAHERSGIHRRLGGPVAAPPNRNELLARLRERANRSPQATSDDAPLRAAEKP
ncbi:MAG: hypothetical protein QM756_15695 [Polyangiaceae bacterium]